MKTHWRVVLVSVMFLPVAFPMNALADPILANNPLIVVDEFGNGTLTFPRMPIGTPNDPLTGVLAPDPGPGGLTSALTYDLLGPPSLVAGDVLLLDPSTLFSDLIRFNPAGITAGYPASLVFYSAADPVGSALADTGPPGSEYTNVVQFTEVTVAGKTGYFGYTPTAKQPGFVVGFSPTYNFISDAAVVTPEPASFSLCLIAAGALFGGRRLLKARAKNT